mmetsp:Transcript_100841/g.289850  ORF Transcript_100841/g.289850 Transcript_100841/m.289850 type:complete len:309 (-) Transcript_100841:4075-5001(-)
MAAGVYGIVVPCRAMAAGVAGIPDTRPAGEGGASRASPAGVAGMPITKLAGEAGARPAGVAGMPRMRPAGVAGIPGMRFAGDAGGPAKAVEVATGAAATCPKPNGVDGAAPRGAGPPTGAMGVPGATPRGVAGAPRGVAGTPRGVAGTPRGVAGTPASEKPPGVRAAEPTGVLRPPGVGAADSGKYCDGVIIPLPTPPGVCKPVSVVPAVQTEAFFRGISSKASFPRNSFASFRRRSQASLKSLRKRVAFRQPTDLNHLISASILSKGFPHNEKPAGWTSMNSSRGCLPPRAQINSPWPTSTGFSTIA